MWRMTLVGGPWGPEICSEFRVTVWWVKEVVREVGCGWQARPVGSLT